MEKKEEIVFHFTGLLVYRGANDGRNFRILCPIYGLYAEEISTRTYGWLEKHFHPSTALVILISLGSISTNSKQTARSLNETSNWRTVTCHLNWARLIIPVYEKKIQRVRKRLYPFLFFFSRCPVCGEWCKLH